jgi:hypothetical protein
LKELPIACDMTALDASQRERQQALMKTFHASIQETEEIEDGYAFRLQGDAETILAAAEFITIERLCCPFLTFELAVGTPDDSVWLRIRGATGVKEFIKAELQAV